MKKSTAILSIFLSSLFTAQTLAQSTQPTTRPVPIELLNSVQDKLHTVDSVEADFVEEKHLAMLDHTLTIHGHFAMQKPDRLIWIVQQPVQYAVSIQGDIVKQWDADTNKVQTINIGGDPTFHAVSEQLSSWFMGNYKALAGSYDLSLRSEKPLTLVFAPKPDSMVAKVLKEIVITFAPDQRNIDIMQITESGGSVTTINYLHTKVNEPVSDKTWEIPPDDR
jgi:outer membrane lipoprotein carrier protein